MDEYHVVGGALFKATSLVAIHNNQAPDVRLFQLCPVEDESLVWTVVLEEQVMGVVRLLPWKAGVGKLDNVAFFECVGHRLPPYRLGRG